MSSEPQPADLARWNECHRVTIGLLAGLAAASFMFFVLAAVQTPGLDPPPESVALFLVATVANVIAYQFLRMNSILGYPAAMLAGITVIAIVAVIVTGTYGPAGPRTNPVGPLAYVGLAVIETFTAIFAWLKGPRAGTSEGSATS